MSDDKDNNETKVKGHYIHRNGKDVWIPEHEMKENENVRERHEHRLSEEIEGLKDQEENKKTDNKYDNKKYEMGIDMQTTSNHPGYSDELSAEENYERGLKFAEAHGYDKLWVARSLEQLANLTHKEVYKEAASLAFQEYDKDKK